MVDWNASGHRIHNLIRGMQPWPGAHTRFRGRLLQLWLSRGFPITIGPAHPVSFASRRDGLFVCTGDGRWLKLLEVQMEGRKKMSALEFARGQRVADNEKLGD